MLALVKLLCEVKVSVVVSVALVLLSVILDAGLSSSVWVSEVSLQEKDETISPTIEASSVNPQTSPSSYSKSFLGGFEAQTLSLPLNYETL